MVTGASRGIGAAIAEMLAAYGWPVAVNYSSDAEGGASVASRITATGGRALPVQADVADPNEVAAMFDLITRDMGDVLVLVNNAGIRKDRLAGGLGPVDWTRVLSVNLSGAFHTIHCALGPMVRQRFGRIVNVSSVSAAQPFPGQSAYAASKAGVEGLTRAVAVEVARRGVTVNAIAPGLVNTTFVPAAAGGMAAGIPARRIAEPREVAACVRFLTSDDAAYLTGALVRVDGGLTAGISVPTQSSPTLGHGRAASVSSECL